MNRITFIGDVMCEPLLMRAARCKDGSYNFDCVFEHVRDMFAESDYVIGNLETPLAGKEAGYTHELFSFNAPEEFVDAIQKAGISYVSTANNHCMDRGFEGVLHTQRVLDEKGLPHHGTHLQPDAREEAVYFSIGDQKLAVISYTYAANYSMHHRDLGKEQERYINLLHPYREAIFPAPPQTKNFAKRALRAAFRSLKEEHRAWIKKKLGMTYNSPRADDYLDEAAAAPYFERLREDIEKAKTKADLVLFYPHVGGQFNIEPGKFSKYTFAKALEFGADAIIASHPHIVQRAEVVSGVPCFYSVGNFNMSPNSVYLLHENLPDYGLAVHLYLEEMKIVRTTFSILKMVETKCDPLTVYPVEQYVKTLGSMEDREKLERDVAQVYTAVTGRQLNGESSICREYELIRQEICG